MSKNGLQAIAGFSTEKCEQRNKIASLRNLQEAAGVRLSGSNGVNLFASEAPTGTLIDSTGDVPKDDAEALTRIRLLQPSGAKPLEQDEIFVHYCEAANSNYVSDRYMFLGSGTLSNIAKCGIAGIAFMNSHRTGGFSSESELPFGRTFCGRYEQYLAEDGQLFERTLIGLYMLRGSKPTGESGPSTDELHRMINGGVLKDVSVGINPAILGKRVCDVCGAEYWGGDCPHYAGSTYQMSEEQKTAQIRRGVLSGVATYSLEDWEMGEVSGVYNGAVPGAGFAKAHAALSSGILPENIATELATAYAAYL